MNMEINDLEQHKEEENKEQNNIFDILDAINKEESKEGDYLNFSVYDTLYVPMESVDLYKNASPWNQFKHIIGVDSSGKPISHIETNSQAYSTKSPNEVKKQIKENSGSSSSSKKSFFDRLRGLWHTTQKG